MRSGQIYISKPVDSSRRTVLISIVLCGLVALIMTALTIPFFYETQSIWYKFGVEKTLLRSGKMVGLVTAILLCTQVLLAVRLKYIDRLVGLDTIYTLHRYNGCALLLFGIVHATLVLIPEGLSNLPIGRKYWPEMVGAAMLLLIAGVVTSALGRRLLDMKYNVWRSLHKPAGYLIFLMVVVHVLYVSKSFAKNAPGYGAYVLFGGIAVIILGKKISTYWQNRKAGEITEIEHLSETVTSVTVKLPEIRSFGYFPGQFAYLAVGSEFRAESHPFTIASSPTNELALQFMIKSCGDWTDELRSVSVGERVRIEGPYGMFSYLVRSDIQDIVMIAGGIGITPLLSMLRFMAENPVSGKVILIWCLSHRADMFLGDELDTLNELIPNLTVNLVITRAKHGSRRLDMDKLASLTNTCGKDANIYLCGPGPMMKRAIEDCLALGFKRKNIHYEFFSL